ncbi:DUF3228 family protein [bacterium]|nr:DUF3228 family protein [bacterium]PIV80912.1 MAG: hypothetical protein COW53_07185 [bacterium CG17_big_fil_post_rev_8_21_14_2_50_64_8]PJA74412.1 MAG: hypothetical protein CO151_09845 [bacterium CG_4_9_14_3_um_filter_65_15]
MKNDQSALPQLGWSDFARARHVSGGGHTWFEGTEEELLGLVRKGWPRREPGAGRSGLDEVVIVPVPPDRFMSATVMVDETSTLRAEFTRRQPHEEGYVRVLATGPREEVRHAAVVLYAADTLLENDGRRSGDFDWEVVCLLAGPVADEPMDPLTMARNMLEKPGGTSCAYTAEQFAAAVWYWSRRAAVDSGGAT